MAKRKIQLVEGEYYHIYNRGNSKQLIFLDDKDRERFVKLIYLCNSSTRIDFRDDIIRMKIDAFEFDRGKPIIAIGAWVLMPNHFHLYVTVPRGYQVSAASASTDKKEKSNISYFVERLCKSYSKYFNAKYKRTGTLFEGKFKTVHIDNNYQAKYLFSYIHLNPVKLIQSDWKEKGITDVKKALLFLDDYTWSSYPDFVGKKRIQSKILNTSVFPDYFPTMNEFNKEIFDWITIKEK